MGISGRIAAMFQSSAITPLLAIVGLLLGIFATIITPKEEEPQIDVTFADVIVPFVGATPAEVENLVTTPLEQVISEIKGIDTLYSFSMAGKAVIIVVFEVGKERNDAIVSLYNKIYSNNDWMPQGMGVGNPIIKPRGIDDVPIVSLTLWSKNPNVGAEQLSQVAHGLETAIKRIPGTRDVYTIGGHNLSVNVRLDPAKMNAFGVNYDDLSNALKMGNMASDPVSLTQQNREIKVQVGSFLKDIEEVRSLVVAVHDGSAVYLQDVANVSLSSALPTQNVWMGASEQLNPAVTIAIAKQPGQNAVDISDQVIERINALDNVLIPADIEVSITRNYGSTAKDKSDTLIGKLVFATIAVVLLVWLTMGIREAFVVGIAIVITLAITLFASWAWGFTLNRVSLFALIFSIGILVDDAIVVVENIHRHMGLNNDPIDKLIPGAVDEVGGPTILATFTVLAALLPMAFVTGLMGPYMAPIPINASMGMLISLIVAFVVTPWLCLKMLNRPKKMGEHGTNPKVVRFFQKLMYPFVTSQRSRLNRYLLGIGILLMIGLVFILPVTQHLVLKMLPFDNKSEFQVIVDMPAGTSLEETQAVLLELAQTVKTVPELKDFQVYAGTAAPMNFNGLVRHYFMREGANVGDIQVNLVDRRERDRDSHAIASSLRPILVAIGNKYTAKVKVVEVPPGPPVWSPILAEVYGPTAEIREQAAKEVLAKFKRTADIVDIDILLPEDQEKWQVSIDRSKAASFSVPYNNIVDAIASSIGGKEVSNLHSDFQKYPIPILLQVEEGAKVDLEGILSIKLKAMNGTLVSIAELVSISPTIIDKPIIHKNMIPMIMVVADMAGELDSPLYGMFDMAGTMPDEGLDFEQYYINQPQGSHKVELLWDGEWTITYETFRDMGIAYAVGMIMIYLLVVAQFKSYLVPLIIMAPIPLTVIGVFPGHALLGAQFTATSMIGMIALAGIIVRNSILLVDFINQEVESGKDFAQAVIHSGAVRAKPIILTGLAAMVGAFFILDDPIFNGLAITLIFGIFISTILTLVVIPVLYYALMNKRFSQ